MYYFFFTKFSIPLILLKKQRYSHGLLPQKAYTDSVSACGWDDFLKNCTKNFFQPSPACIGATNQALSYIPSNINVTIFIFLLKIPL